MPTRSAGPFRHRHPGGTHNPFTVLLHLPGGHTADIVRDAMITAMGKIPKFRPAA